MDIKILVITHKTYWMPNDNVYIPLHVGRTGKKDLGFIGDDTGNNISEKNPNFCELTGLYWAWKNLKCSYIGICHYRRYFGKRQWSYDIDDILNRSEYEELLMRNDFILPCKSNFYFQNVKEQYAESHYLKDLNRSREIIKAIHPEYLFSFDKVMNSHRAYCYNMLVTKKRAFDNYCEWLFSILFKLEEIIDLSQYSAYNKRVFGFLSERLFNVWLDHNSPHIIEVPVVCLEEKNRIRGQMNCFRHSLRYKLYKKRSEREWLESTID